MGPSSSSTNQPGQPARAHRARSRQRGQGLIIFVAATVFLVGLLAIVVDVTWYWARTLQVQRAADAAALAGAVWLPEQPTTATSVALASAKQNGYTPGAGVTVTAVQDDDRDVQLNTRVSAPVPTFFMRLFGINSIQATRTAKAEYVLPVPMGSPLNYFGAFGALRGTIHVDPGFWYATATKLPTGSWTNVNNALNATDQVYAVTVNQNLQGFGNFNIPMRGTSQSFEAEGGIEVKVVGKASVAAGCKIQVDVSRNGGSSWRGGTVSPYSNGQSVSPGASQTLGTADTTLVFGGEQSTNDADTGDWFGWTNWNSGQFSNANFQVRVKPLGSPCIDSIDSVSVKVTYDAVNPPVTGPEGESLVQQGVWATALSQGADVVNGDIYSPKDNGSGSNSEYAPQSYYDYAVELQPGTTNGSVFIFDPVFCATNGNGSQGMGDRWFGSGAMSTFYDLYDTNNTPYTFDDDTWIAGNTGPTGASNPLYGLFRRSNRFDASQGQSNPSGGSETSCELGATTVPTDGAYWHNRWWQLKSGVAGPGVGVLTPRIYRIRVTTTDLASPSDQNSVDAQNSFSIFADVAGHTCPNSPIDLACPRVYGLGTMEAFTPLNSSTSADLYLSQIGAAYAGKTIKVSLWDPGDTGGLTADLSFRMPTATGYQSANFTWTATRFSTSGSASNCNGSSSGSVTSVRTNNSGSQRFNGCWIVINIPIPQNYLAPTPPGEPGPGWWKIRYTMGNEGGSAFDLTTWKTQLIGNPVHLIVP